MRTILERIENLFGEVNPDLLKHLNPQLDAKEVIKLKLHNLPQSYIQLLQWHNGTDLKPDTPLEHFWFSFGLIFLSFEDAVKRKVILQNLTSLDNFLFPIFSSEGHDYLLINVGEPAKNKIYFYSPSNPDFDGVISIYDSLENFLITIQACMEQKAYYRNSDGFQANMFLERKISRDLNPNSDYWKIV